MGGGPLTPLDRTVRYTVTIHTHRPHAPAAFARLLKRLLGPHGTVVEVSGPDRPRTPLVRFTVPVGLTPKARPRFGKGRVYTPRSTIKAEVAVAQEFIHALPGHRPDGRSLFEVRIVTAHRTRHRRDVDNLSKTVLDALNGLAWEDDSQVVHLSVQKGLVAQGEWTSVQLLTYDTDTEENTT